MDKQVPHTAELIDVLRWYETRANHGRGRVIGNTRKLASAGLIRIQCTGFYDWCATITEKGRAAIASAKVQGGAV